MFAGLYNSQTQHWHLITPGLDTMWMSVVLLATLKNIMETKGVFCGLIFNKDERVIYNPMEQNRAAWPEFLFLQIGSWSFEVLPFFLHDIPLIPNHSMFHVSTMMTVLKCIYLCIYLSFCLGETVNLQLDLLHSSLKQDKVMLARGQLFHYLNSSRFCFKSSLFGFLTQILITEERTCYLPLIFSEK